MAQMATCPPNAAALGALKAHLEVTKTAIEALQDLAASTAQINQMFPSGLAPVIALRPPQPTDAA
jgi:hypothetical protein